MKTTVGLWIDHRKAIIVAVTGKGEETKLIISKVEKQPGRFAGVRSTTPYESQQVRADDSRERKFTGHLNIYYDASLHAFVMRIYSDLWSWRGKRRAAKTDQEKQPRWTHRGH